MNQQLPAMFEAHPALARHIPYLPLATLPTPVQPAPDFAQRHGIASLHLKRDDQSGVLYGGNKTRKLGFLLAAAQARGARSVITFGAAGSNHALATARYARECGMAAALVLGPQHNSRHVRENLQAMYESGAWLCPCAWKEVDETAARVFHELWRRDGAAPYVIPPGGSSPVGALGFVSAAYEIKQQVEQGMLPEPEVVYVASGTMGTCVGLALGFYALKMKTQVMAVRVTVAPYTSMEHAATLFAAVNNLLRGAGAAFPRLDFEKARFVIRDEFFGEDYALYTPEGVAAIRVATDELGITLEGTYTGKAFAGLLADATDGRLKHKNVVFWNTYNGDAVHATPTPTPFDHHMLPDKLHGYFESPDAFGCDAV